MLARVLAGLVMLFALGEGLVVFGAEPAQTSSHDFRPDVADVAPSAFQSSHAAQIAAAGAPVQQTDVRSAAAPFSDMLIRWQPPPSLAGMLTLAVRLSSDGRAWTAWMEVSFDSDLSRPAAPADGL